jgi:hypothetical protein
MTSRHWLFVAIGALFTGGAVASTGADPVATDLQVWIDLLKNGGPYALSVAAVIFALRKDNEVKEQAASHATDLKAINTQMMALLGANTTAQVEMKGAMNALTTALGGVERVLDRSKP